MAPKAKAPKGELAGRAAIVTGAARGLGADIVRALHAQGARVAFSYLSSGDAGKKLEEELGHERVFSARADVSKEEEAGRFTRAVLKEFGRVDILVNNASYSKDDLWNMPIDKVPTEEFVRVLAVDLVGSFNMSKFAVPAMRRQKFGRIVNFSSAGSIGGDETMIAYNAAKVGIVGLTRTLARAEARKGITVNAIAPGSVDTGWIERWGLSVHDLKETLKEIPVGRIGQPMDIVHAVMFLVSDKAGFVTGQTIRVDGGVNFG